MAQDDPSSAPDRLTCPFCEKAYRFRPELVDKKVRCTGCEAKLKVPKQGGAFEVLESPPGHDAEGGIDTGAGEEGYDISEPLPARGGGGEVGRRSEERLPVVQRRGQAHRVALRELRLRPCRRQTP